MSEENKDTGFDQLNTDENQEEVLNETPEVPEEEKQETPQTNIPNSIPGGSFQEAMPNAALRAKEEALEASKNPPKKEGARRDPETGEFMEGNTVKYYQNIVNRPQIEKEGRMVFADDMTECGYLTDLTPEQVAEKRAAGDII